MRVLPRVGYRRRGAERLLEREQSFKHADRRVEGLADRAALRLAIPAAVPELFAQQTIDESIAALTEIGAERDDTAVDARLDLTFEEGRVSESGSPGDVVANAIDRGAHARACAVEPEVAQKDQCVQVRPPERSGDAVAPWPSGRC